jgi:hypothetical protein
MARLSYTEICKERIKEKRNVVISETFDSEGKFMGYSVTEQLVAEENGKEVNVFLKNSLGILDDNGLLGLYNAVEYACEKAGLIQFNVPEEQKEENTN